MNKKNTLITLAVLILLFVVLSIFVLSGLTQGFNDAVYNQISVIITPTITLLMIIISNLGEWFVYIPVALLFLIIPRSRIKVGVPAALTLAFAAGLSLLLKLLFHIDRPSAHRLISISGYGYPSSHAMIGTAFVGICAYLFCKYTYKRPLKVGVIIFSTLFLFLIGLSRIYLGVHNPTDVIAGYTCGIIVMLAAILGSQ